MTTRNLVPRVDGEGHIGVEDKKWQGMATKVLTADDIISPVIDAIHQALGKKAAQTAVEAILVTLATKATQTDLETVEVVANAAATKVYVDEKLIEVNKKIEANLSPFERDENGDLMPKIGGEGNANS